MNNRPNIDANYVLEKALFTTIEHKSLNSEEKASQLKKIIATMMAISVAAQIYEKEVMGALERINLSGNPKLPPLPNIDARNDAGNTAVVAACQLNEAACLRLLIDAKACISLKDSNGMMPIQIAVVNEAEACLRILLPYTPEIERDRLLFFAVPKNNPTYFTILLEAKANPNVLADDYSARTPLIEAARQGRSVSLTVLIKAGAQPDILAKNKITALMEAAEHGHASCVRLLIDAKAKLNLQEYLYSETALSLAVINMHHACIELLIEAKANLDLQNNQGNTVLMQSARLGDLATIKSLLKAGADVNILNHKLLSALIFAIRSKNTDCVKLLLNAGADLTQVTSRGRYALEYALEQHQIPIISLLLDFGALNHISQLKSQDLTNYLYYASAQNAPPHLMNFCRGMLAEKLAYSSEAEKYYKNAMAYPPALRHLGDLNVKKGNFLIAANNYLQALSREDFFTPGKLVSLTQQLQRPDSEKKHEAVAENAKQKKELIEEKNNALTVLQIALTHLTLTSRLTVEQWLFLAVDAVSNPFYQQRDGIRFSLSSAEKALKLAKTERDIIEAKQTWLSTWGVFSRTTRESFVLDAAGIVADYCGATKNKPAICDAVIRSFSN